MHARPPAARRGAASLVVAVVLLGAASLAACSADSDGAAGGAPERSTTIAPPGPSGAFSLLTYNVAGLPAEISKEDPKAHIPLISPLLDEYEIVLTQEDFDWWGDLAGGLDFANYHDRLRAEATHEHRSPRHPGPEAVELPAARGQVLIGDGLGVLSRFPIEGNTRVPWTGCFGGFDTSDGGAADCLAMKGFLMTRVALDDGLTLDLYDLHLEAGGTAKDQAIQADDVAQLAAFIEEHSKGRAVIVGGDTNLHTDDVHPDGGRGADTELWRRFLADTGLTDACAATACTDTGRIDKVAYRSGGGLRLEATSHDVPSERFRDAEGDDLSDHEPVVVGFGWSAS